MMNIPKAWAMHTTAGKRGVLPRLRRQLDYCHGLCSPVFLHRYPQAAIGLLRTIFPPTVRRKSLSQDEVARFLGAVDNLKHRVLFDRCLMLPG